MCATCCTVYRLGQLSLVAYHQVHPQSNKPAHMSSIVHGLVMCLFSLFNRRGLTNLGRECHQVLLGISSAPDDSKL